MIPEISVVVARVRAGLGLRSCGPAVVLGHREQRSLVIKLDTDAGPVVAKVTGDDGAARTARALGALAAVPPADLLPLRIPRLLLHDPAVRLVVVEHIAGAAVADHLTAGDFTALAITGRAMARLHGAAVLVGPRRELPGHLADLIHPHPLLLAAAVPELAPLLAKVLDRLRAGITEGQAASRLRRSREVPFNTESESGRVCQTRSSPVHRDLHPRQLIRQGESVALLDWDLAAQGDPAIDVGNLRAWLQHRQPDVAGPAIQAFESGYLQVGDPGVLDRAAGYAAFTRLRLAAKGYRQGGRAALPTTRRLLGEAVAILEEPAHAFS